MLLILHSSLLDLQVSVVHVSGEIEMIKKYQCSNKLQFRRIYKSTGLGYFLFWKLVLDRDGGRDNRIVFYSDKQGWKESINIHPWAVQITGSPDNDTKKGVSIAKLGVGTGQKHILVWEQTSLNWLYFQSTKANVYLKSTSSLTHDSIWNANNFKTSFHCFCK